MIDHHASNRSPRRGRAWPGGLAAASAALVLVLDGGAAWAHTSSGGGGPSITHRLADLGPGAVAGIAVAVYVVLALLDQTASRLARGRHDEERPSGER